MVGCGLIVLGVGVPGCRGASSGSWGGGGTYQDPGAWGLGPGGGGGGVLANAYHLGGGGGG